MEDFKKLVVSLFEKRAEEAQAEYKAVLEAAENIKISASSEERS